MKIDLTNVEPGHVFSMAQCEEAIGFPRDRDRYQWNFMLMQLCEQVQKQLWNSGKHFTVVTSKSEIRVLTHAEASEYNANMFDNAIKKMRRTNRKLMAVDTTGFSENALVSHEKAIVKQSRILAMMKPSRATLQMVAHNDGLPKRS